MTTEQQHDPRDTGDQDEHADVDRQQQPTWSRAVIFGAAALAALLIGATIGLFIGQNRTADPVPQSTPQADSVEVGFAQDMSWHHLQAVTMANWARTHSDDPAVVQLAFDIASVQQEQIGRMKGWLMLWHQPEEALGEPMKWMSGGHDHGAGGGTQPSSGENGGMPGMATDSELEKLRSLSGTELDVYFLQLMLRHHEGGVEMAQYAQDYAAVSAVRTLAKSMLVSQGAEMDTMRGMLAERGAEPLPFP